MVRVSQIDEILAVFESDAARFDSHQYSNVPVPFPVSPREYLAFAEAGSQGPPSARTGKCSVECQAVT